MLNPASRVPRIAWILLALATLGVVVIILFDWNWLRGPISNYLSTKFGRPVAISGNLRGEFSFAPRLIADNVTLANMSWGTDPLMARAQQIALRVDVLSLFGPTVSLPEVTLVRPVLLLERDADGHPNWDFGGAPELPKIGRMNIDAGIVYFRDPAPGTDITVDVASDRPTEGGELPVRFKGTGKLRKNDFTIEGHAATVLALEDPERPYRLAFQAKAGTTSARFNGTIVPARIDNVDGTLSL